MRRISRQRGKVRKIGCGIAIEDSTVIVIEIHIIRCRRSATTATMRTFHSKYRNAFRDIRRHQIRIALDGLRTREVFPAGDGLVGSSRRDGLRGLRRDASLSFRTC